MCIDSYYNYFSSSEKLRYYFAASYTSSIITTTTLLALKALNGDFIRRQKLVNYGRLPLVAALGTLPLTTVQFSKQVVGAPLGSQEFSPVIAALSGWLGSSVVLSSNILLEQLAYFKNLNHVKRWCMASKIGSSAAFGVAFALSARKYRTE